MVLELQNSTRELRQLLTKPWGTWCSKQGIKGNFILKQGIEENQDETEHEDISPIKWNLKT